MNSEQLELILEVIDRGNFSAAARALNRVPSAVSMAIANLEAELNLKLFERSKNYLEPTEIALSIEPHARLIVTKLRQLEMHLTELSMGLETNLKIGVAADINQKIVLAGIEDLTHRYPLLNIEMHCAAQQELKARLRNNEIDLYVAYSSSTIDTNERFRLFGVEKFVLIWFLVIDHFDLEMVSVPEPSGAVLFALGSLALIARRRITKIRVS